MADNIGRCKYCGSRIRGGEMCTWCKEKLPLVRKLQGMVRNEKEKVERSKDNGNDR